MEKNYRVFAEKENQLHRAAGALLSRFSNLETQLMFTYSQALSVPHATAAALLAPVKTFSLSLEMTNSAVQLKIAGTPATAYWNSLVEYIRELSGDRNFVAHTPVVAHGAGAPSTVDWAEVTPRVGPSMVGHFIGIEKIPALDESEVLELVADTQQAIELLMDFTSALAEQTTSQQKFASPVARRRPTRKQRQATAPKAQRPRRRPSRP